LSRARSRSGKWHVWRPLAHSQPPGFYGIVEPNSPDRPGRARRALHRRSRCVPQSTETKQSTHTDDHLILYMIERSCEFGSGGGGGGPRQGRWRYTCLYAHACTSVCHVSIFRVSLRLATGRVYLVSFLVCGIARASRAVLHLLHPNRTRNSARSCIK
jgi:hypothetical protein